jgi:hypothetical protein
MTGYIMLAFGQGQDKTPSRSELQGWINDQIIAAKAYETAGE